MVNAMENLEFSLEFNSVSAVDLSAIRVNHAEVRSVFHNKNSKFVDLDEFRFAIGYSNKSKFLSIPFDTKTEIANIRVLKVYLSNETEIQKIYCSPT
jgi:hypothetical protein